MRKGWVVVLLAAGGCPFGVPTLEDGFEDSLTETGGCGDLVAYAADVDNERMLRIDLDQPIVDAGGEPVAYTVALPDAGATAVIEVGSRISDAMCTDVIENGGPTVLETWTAVSGTLEVSIEPQDYGAIADLTLTDAVFESPDGEQVTVEVFEWTDLNVGWLPG